MLTSSVALLAKLSRLLKEIEIGTVLWLLDEEGDSIAVDRGALLADVKFVHPDGQLCACPYVLTDVRAPAFL